MARSIAWLRANLFNGIASSLVTVVLLYLIARAAWGVIDWGLVHAVWRRTRRPRLPSGERWRGRVLGVSRRVGPLHPVRPLSL